MAPSARPRACLAPTSCAYAVALSLAFAALLAPSLAVEYVAKSITTTPGYKLLPGILSVPAPVIVAPDQDWSGVDGTWNSFSLQVGNPPANVRVQVSTASQQIWVVNRQACLQNITDAKGSVIEYNHLDMGCSNSRGELFNTTASQTWRQKGFYRL
jgi:hypothetical protein